MGRDLSSHNKKIVENKLRKSTESIEERITKVLTMVAQEIVLYIEGARQIPVYTGNLQDSTGVGVYRNGVLRSYMPTQTATVAQEYAYRPIWGTEELAKALNVGATEFSKGIWIVLFSAVPYAWFIDDKYNFFEDGVAKELLNTFYSYMKTEFPNSI